MDKVVKRCGKCLIRQGDYREKSRTNDTVIGYCQFPLLVTFLSFVGTVTLISDSLSCISLPN